MKRILSFVLCAMAAATGWAQRTDRMEGFWLRDSITMGGSTTAELGFYGKLYCKGMCLIYTYGTVNVRDYYIKGDTAIVENHIVSPIRFITDDRMTLTWINDAGQKVAELWHRCTIDEAQKAVADFYGRCLFVPFMEKAEKDWRAKQSEE